MLLTGSVDRSFECIDGVDRYDFFLAKLLLTDVLDGNHSNEATASIGNKLREAMRFFNPDAPAGRSFGDFLRWRTGPT